MFKYKLFVSDGNYGKFWVHKPRGVWEIHWDVLVNTS